jgi:hypothetical protein
MNLQDESSNDESAFVESVNHDNDATFMYCVGKFSEDISREEWIICLIWAHVVCSSVEKSEYVCDFCA